MDILCIAKWRPRDVLIRAPVAASPLSIWELWRVGRFLVHGFGAHTSDAVIIRCTMIMQSLLVPCHKVAALWGAAHEERGGSSTIRHAHLPSAHFAARVDSRELAVQLDPDYSAAVVGSLNFSVFHLFARLWVSV